MNYKTQELRDTIIEYLIQNEPIKTTAEIQEEEANRLKYYPTKIIGDIYIDAGYLYAECVNLLGEDFNFTLRYHPIGYASIEYYDSIFFENKIKNNDPILRECINNIIISDESNECKEEFKYINNILYPSRKISTFENFVKKLTWKGETK